MAGRVLLTFSCTISVVGGGALRVFVRVRPMLNEWRGSLFCKSCNASRALGERGKPQDAGGSGCRAAARPLITLFYLFDEYYLCTK